MQCNISMAKTHVKRICAPHDHPVGDINGRVVNRVFTSFRQGYGAVFNGKAAWGLLGRPKNDVFGAAMSAWRSGLRFIRD